MLKSLKENGLTMNLKLENLNKEKLQKEPHGNSGDKKETIRKSINSLRDAQQQQTEIVK